MTSGTPALPTGGTITRDEALRRDAVDPLARWRDEFVVDDPSIVYLDGNSLGRAPRRTLDRVARVMRDEWAGGLTRSWGMWVDMPQRVGDRLAPLIGARPGECVVHDSTTVNLYQLVHAAIALRPDRRVIAIDEGEFPTDRYVVDGIAAATGRTVRHGFDDLGDVAVVVRSVVDYRTAEVADVAAETARGGAAGALTIWDLSHAAGVLAIDLHAAGAELAVGCSYKFLNGGPGAPAWSFVAASLQAEIRQPIWGWFGQHDLFAMGSTYAPRPDIGRLLLGTPSIIALAAAEEGFALTAEAGIDAIAEKASALTGFGIELCDQWGLATCTPRDAARRGGHVAIVHAEARSITTALTARGVIGDFREPDIIRLGMSPLTTSFADVFDGIRAVADHAAKVG